VSFALVLKPLNVSSFALVLKPLNVSQWCVKKSKLEGTEIMAKKKIPVVKAKITKVKRAKRKSQRYQSWEVWSLLAGRPDYDEAADGVLMDHYPDQRVDPPKEEDFEEQQEARERDGEMEHDVWQEEGYPERD
jgi:hypothetical protein